MGGTPGSSLTGFAPGWYPDPVIAGLVRWWDGARWSNATQTIGPGPSPGYLHSPVYPMGPPKKFYQRVWFWIVLVLVLLLGGCAALVGIVGVAANHVINDTHTVVYQVTGHGTADITYFNIDTSGSSGTASDNRVAMPWSRTVIGKGAFASYSVSALLDSGSTITCKITIDGVVRTTQTSTGPLSYVDCIASP